MGKHSIILVSILSFILILPFSAYPETIKLKNGNIIRAKIVERTGEYIKVDISGIPITYYFEDIESIDGKRVSISLDEEVISPDEVFPSERRGVVTGRAYDYIKKGNYYLDRDQYRAAIEEFQKALQLDQENAQAYYGLGLAHGHLGEHQHAMFCYGQAINIKHNYIEAYRSLAATYSFLGKTKEAIEHFKKVVDLDPDSARAHNDLGFVYSFLGQSKEAHEQFEKAIQISPRNARSHFGLGLTYLDSARYEKGLESLKKAQELFQLKGDKKSAQHIDLYLRKKFPETRLEDEVFNIE